MISKVAEDSLPVQTENPSKTFQVYTRFVAPKRAVNRVFIHCSDSDVKSHDNIETVFKWHTQERGWKDIGYHFFIQANGTIWCGRPLEIIPSAQINHNTGTIALCLHGKTKFTPQQFESLNKLCNDIYKAYNKKISFYGHRDVAPDRTCPNFEVKEILKLE